MTERDLPVNLFDMEPEEIGKIVEAFCVRGGTLPEAQFSELAHEPATWSPRGKLDQLGCLLREIGLGNEHYMDRTLLKRELLAGIVLREVRTPLFEIILWFIPGKVWEIDDKEPDDIFALRVWNHGGSCTVQYFAKRDDVWIKPLSTYLATCQEMGIEPYYGS